PDCVACRTRPYTTPATRPASIFCAREKRGLRSRVRSTIRPVKTSRLTTTSNSGPPRRRPVPALPSGCYKFSRSAKGRRRRSPRPPFPDVAVELDGKAPRRLAVHPQVHGRLDQLEFHQQPSPTVVPHQVAACVHRPRLDETHYGVRAA